MIYVDIKELKLATYNPRKIEDDKIMMLSESIKKIGFVIPIIFNKNNNVVLAGHQRIRASKLLGNKKVPAVGVDIRDIDEEVNFNILHNTLDRSKHSATRSRKIKEIISKYGNIFYGVINESGEVLYGSDYLATDLENKNIITIKKDYSKYFLENYGKYDYNGFHGHDYNQIKAQMNRAETMRSQLYTRYIYDYFDKNKKVSLLDFGSGKGFEANRLRNIGADIDEIEFYHKDGYRKTDEMINKFLSRKKSYDGLIVDSVFNSVTELKYQKSIIVFANSVLKTGGHLFLSSRSAKFYFDRLAKNKVDNGKKSNKVYSLDENNFAMSFKKGVPFFQKFDEKEKTINMIEQNGFRLIRSFEHTSFYLEFEKTQELNIDEISNAIKDEFSLPKQDGTKFEYAKNVLSHVEYLLKERE